MHKQVFILRRKLTEQQILLLKLFTSFSENCWTIQFHLGVSLFNTIAGVLTFATGSPDAKRLTTEPHFYGQPVHKNA